MFKKYTVLTLGLLLAGQPAFGARTPFSKVPKKMVVNAARGLGVSIVTGFAFGGAAGLTHEAFVPFGPVAAIVGSIEMGGAAACAAYGIAPQPRIALECCMYGWIAGVSLAHMARSLIDSNESISSAITNKNTLNITIKNSEESPIPLKNVK